MALVVEQVEFQLNSVDKNVRPPTLFATADEVEEYDRLLAASKYADVRIERTIRYAKREKGEIHVTFIYVRNENDEEYNLKLRLK